MSQQGTIVSLQLCPGYRKPMTKVTESEIISNLGMKGDAHARENNNRQILLVEEETLTALQLQPGIVKENVTTSGITLMNLEAGKRLQLGNDVVLEITQVCHPCSRIEEIREGLQRELAGKRGMLAKVISGGYVRRGDSIHVVEHSA